MLVLSRKVGQSLIVGDETVITVTAISDDHISVTVTTSNAIAVDRNIGIDVNNKLAVSNNHKADFHRLSSQQATTITDGYGND